MTRALAIDWNRNLWSRNKDHWPHSPKCVYMKASHINLSGIHFQISINTQVKAATLWIFTWESNVIFLLHGTDFWVIMNRMELHGIFQKGYKTSLVKKLMTLPSISYAWNPTVPQKQKHTLKGNGYVWLTATEARWLSQFLGWRTEVRQHNMGLARSEPKSPDSSGHPWSGSEVISESSVYKGLMSFDCFSQERRLIGWAYWVNWLSVWHSWWRWDGERIEGDTNIPCTIQRGNVRAHTCGRAATQHISATGAH